MEEHKGGQQVSALLVVVMAHGWGKTKLYPADKDQKHHDRDWTNGWWRDMGSRQLHTNVTTRQGATPKAVNRTKEPPPLGHSCT